MTAVAIGALVLAAACVALVFWAARWARASASQLAAGDAERAALRQRVDVVTRDVQDRDRAIANIEAELQRERASRAAVARQRDDAQAVVEALATKDPVLVAAAIRHQLGRLQAVDVPAGDGAAAGPATTPG